MYRPRLGERVMIEVLPSGETITGEVQMVGEDDLLAVTVPARDPDPLASEQTVRVTFVRKDGLYEEEGSVRELEPGSSDDTATLVLRLSGEPTRTQRRDFVRRDASLNAELDWNASRTRCVTKDVSGGGISMLFGEVPPIVEGTEFAVALNVPDGRLPIQAHCRAKYVREVLRGSRWLVGSQFIGIAEDDRQRIVRFVFRLELAQKRPR